MGHIVIVGFQGRMSGELQALCREKNLPYKVFSPKAEAEVRVSDFNSARGVIDFSTPDAAIAISQKVIEAQVPWVCGTTGWPSLDERDRILSSASKAAPVLFDSNFSLGIEILCRCSEELAKSLDLPVHIIDFHHQHKKDSPSGTALKIADRMREVRPGLQIEFQDIRAGQLAGEHQVFVAWGEESLQLTHRAQSRRVFSEGALKALSWLEKQKPGLYRMKDVR